MLRIPARLARKPLPVTSSEPPEGHRQARLNQLCQTVQGCRACPSMEGRRRVLTSVNGTVAARVMFIAEAPGRAGADRTGVPLHGDPSGNMFERLLASVGWTRADVFVTNAVLCNPRDERGLNRPPEPSELANCSTHLESQIRLVDPVVVVTLGEKPLAALALIYPHKYKMSETVGTVLRWAGRKLVPLYHPSPRALYHRNFARQSEDFLKLKEICDAAD